MQFFDSGCRRADWMAISDLTDEGPSIQACGSAAADRVDVGHGQVVWMCIDNERKKQQLRTHTK
ncbi:hypothetical protein RHMOL_Rhmol08G0124900 [Rhododendron molle]|uniref:Uncharacterized protein n=1 Tax=Rhododendron molle TaxID=49168 RepID=A0ACC0MMV4_RHOML|nr:hypothetical protein RHMOL_Rhmol08G0124900 [Rhododendron molle]